MNNVKKKLDQGLAFITCTIMGFMVLVAIWQVFTRYVLNSPSTISEELLRYSLIWVSMLGAAYAFGNKKHIAIEFIVEKLSPKKALRMSILIEILVVLFAVIVMVVGGIMTVNITMAQSSASLGIPMGYIYLSLPVSGILVIGYSVINIYEAIIKRKVELYSKEMDGESVTQLHG
ncbi:TRAP-type C4-dicarboxylate transport system, small permease component [Fictibacillus solisalsi]|uniref:TRAP-type C4-dicarboxylate transport system, small permease component n=1 Tax=Fictibacillus solisalsi TaxID=459525 RepID=A0A1G9VKS8_9BACL|nr:TRAP transporter small permease [Fictibacillus solisalsi]SDM72769.1 TRAP-type C4-dicarboxylate transport system, small permease component [Fictibacillus solisalsi]